MLRDNWAGLIDPMRAARELNPLALFPEQEKSSVDRPQDALKIPAPKGRNLTLTENAASPFHAEPRQAPEASPKSAAVSKTDQRRLITFQHNWLDLAHFGLGGTMLGYGLAGTVVVIVLVIFIVRAL